jgi:hypothetical protein
VAAAVASLILRAPAAAWRELDLGRSPAMLAESMA